MTDRTPLTRAELVDMLKFVLEQNRSLAVGKWPVGRDGAALAGKIADQFDLAGYQVTRGPGATAHGMAVAGKVKPDEKAPTIPVYKPKG